MNSKPGCRNHPDLHTLEPCVNTPNCRLYKTKRKPNYLRRVPYRSNSYRMTTGGAYSDANSFRFCQTNLRCTNFWYGYSEFGAWFIQLKVHKLGSLEYRQGEPPRETPSGPSGSVYTYNAGPTATAVIQQNKNSIQRENMNFALGQLVFSQRTQLNERREERSEDDSHPSDLWRPMTFQLRRKSCVTSLLTLARQTEPYYLKPRQLR